MWCANMHPSLNRRRSAALPRSRHSGDALHSAPHGRRWYALRSLRMHTREPSHCVNTVGEAPHRAVSPGERGIVDLSSQRARTLEGGAAPRSRGTRFATTSQRLEQWESGVGTVFSENAHEGGAAPRSWRTLFVAWYVIYLCSQRTRMRQPLSCVLTKSTLQCGSTAFSENTHKEELGT